jgi:hypothetical protein
VPLAKAITDQAPRDGEVHLLPVQGNDLHVDGGRREPRRVGRTRRHAAGERGPAAMTDKVQAALGAAGDDGHRRRRFPNRCSGANCPGLQWGWASPYINTVISSPLPPRPLRYIIDTNDAADHVGGNAKIAASGFFPRGGGFRGAVAHERPQRLGDRARERPQPHERVRQQAASGVSGRRVAHRHVLRLAAQAARVRERRSRSSSTRPRPPPPTPTAWYSSGHSEVIHAGSLFSTISYPLIDLQKGGSIQGVIDGLNQILDLAVAEYRAQGGTWIIRAAAGCRTRPTSPLTATCS